MKAILRNYRQAPRKVRLVADAIRGERVQDAIRDLSFMPKRAALAVKKLVESATANAKNSGVSSDNLYIEEIRVDKGMTLHRIMPRARGRASRIAKESSHIMVKLGEK